ncbi:SEC-C motif domain protein [Candidatus Magnetomorum sp. HK-1]|nr:SEC-C motif domain protein [Candidatus Magnetomorum sp. HK-1]
MTYKEIYLQLIHKTNKEDLIRLFKETDNWERLNAINLKIIGDQELPYVLVTIDHQNDLRNGYFASVMIGLYIEKEFIIEIDSRFNNTYFYLPIIAKPNKIPEIAKQYYSEENAIKHELIHINDILKWIEEDPTYIENSIQYNQNAVTKDTVEKSIAFEIEKIFKLEPGAMELDYDNGENLIIQPFIGNKYLTYQCKTKKEYVKMKISEYLHPLKMAYIDKFPEKKDTIYSSYLKSLDQYGKKIFGNEPYKELERVITDLASKLIASNLGSLSTIKKHLNAENKSIHIKQKVPKQIEKGENKSKIGRNTPCPCGSGKKYKKCCLR